MSGGLNLKVMKIKSLKCRLIRTFYETGIWEIYRFFNKLYCMKFTEEIKICHNIFSEVDNIFRSPNCHLMAEFSN